MNNKTTVSELSKDISKLKVDRRCIYIGNNNSDAYYELKYFKQFRNSMRIATIPDVIYHFGIYEFKRAEYEESLVEERNWYIEDNEFEYHVKLYGTDSATITIAFV